LLAFKENQIHEDDYFNISCFGKIKRISKIKNAFYFYRLRQDSLSKTIDTSVLEKRMHSFVNLIALTERVKDLDANFLSFTREECKIRLYNVLDIFLDQNVSSKRKYATLKFVKNNTGRISLNDNDYSSRIRLIKKRAYNKNSLLYLICKKIFFLYDKFK
jgi:hypothetical protein